MKKMSKKKMTIVIAVLVVNVLVTYFASKNFVYVGPSWGGEKKPKVALVVEVDKNGNVVDIKSVTHDGDNLCILHNVLFTPCESFPPPTSTWRKMNGYWKCV